MQRNLISGGSKVPVLELLEQPHDFISTALSHS